MSSSTVAVQVPAPKEALPSFEEWLRDKLGILTLPVLITIANLVVNLSSHFGWKGLSEILQGNSLEFTSHVLQGSLIFVLLLLVPPNFLSGNPKHSKAVEAAEEFRMAWFFTLVSWLTLYIIFALKANPTFKINPPAWLPWLKILEGAVSCLSTVGFWVCFLIVSNPSSKSERKAATARWVGIILFLVAMNILAHLFDKPVLSFLVGLSIGALSGVAMAFFIGRLESRLLRPPRWLLMALYCYAVLQFAYGFLDIELKLSTNWQPFFFFCVMLLKILLALFVSWLLGTGNLLLYLRFVSDINDDYPGRRVTFLAELDEKPLIS